MVFLCRKLLTDQNNERKQWDSAASPVNKKAGSNAGFSYIFAYFFLYYMQIKLEYLHIFLQNICKLRETIRHIFEYSFLDNGLLLVLTRTCYLNTLEKKEVFTMDMNFSRNNNMKTKEDIVAELLQDLKQAENRAEKEGWIDSSALENELGVLKNE